jgi:hypothetical protein
MEVIADFLKVYVEEKFLDKKELVGCERCFFVLSFGGTQV